MKKITLTVSSLIILLGCSCSPGCDVNSNKTDNASSEKTQVPLSLVNWNLQTFFDATKDGCEYKEFQKSGDWGKEKYEQRLNRLCQVITALDADIYVFEELENEAVIYDLSNALAGSGQNWNQKKFWNYSTFAKQEGTAIGIGILSRYPLLQAKTHAMDIRIHRESQPSVRYILEALIQVQGKQLTVLANHWKSKLGGTEQTEIWRDWQESILAKRLRELDKTNVIICGDFNRDAADFVCNFKDSSSYLQQEKNTILRYADFGFTDYTSASSFWFSDQGNLLYQTGSYVYDDTWERIDNILVSENIRITDAGPCTSSPWALAKGYPASYKMYSGEGYSDHLPVMVKLLLSD